MSPSVENLTCPVCSATLNFEQILGRLESDRTFDRMVTLSVPLGTLVLQYLTLFTPPKQRLTNSKKLRLIAQLLPDLERRAIAHKGRDWDAPWPAWAQAIDQMLSARAADRLSLPMTGHAYLYSILAGLADKHEGAAEQQREREQRTGPRPGTVQVRGQATTVVDALPGARDPVLLALDAATRNAAPMPDAIRERLEQLKKGKS